MEREDVMKRWKQIRGRIRRPDPEIRRKALRHWNNLTKPLGSLGRLEETAIRLAGITGEVVPDLSRKAVLVMCGDHGVAEEGVSAYPQEVTGLMIDNFARGGAAINVLARRFGAELVVVDVGSKATKLPPSVIDRRVRPGTANMTAGPAMTREEALQALDVGIDRVEELVRGGVRMIAIGEMGIGNTTAGTAIAAVFTGRPVEVLTGRGTGIDDRAVLRKREAIRRAIRRSPIHRRPVRWAYRDHRHGGAVLGGGSEDPVVLDRMISTAAAWRRHATAGVSESCLPPICRRAASTMLEELGLGADRRRRCAWAKDRRRPCSRSSTELSLAREMATFADLVWRGRRREGSTNPTTRGRYGDAYGGIGALRPRRGRLTATERFGGAGGFSISVPTFTAGPPPQVLGVSGRLRAKALAQPLSDPLSRRLRTSWRTSSRFLGAAARRQWRGQLIDLVVRVFRPSRSVCTVFSQI